MGELIIFAGGFLMGAFFGILVIGIVVGAKIDRGGEDL